MNQLLNVLSKNTQFIGDIVVTVPKPQKKRTGTWRAANPYGSAPVPTHRGLILQTSLSAILGSENSRLLASYASFVLETWAIPSV